ncbi:hypothetical protein RDI58_027170 [Solanum bulbocastanum]|uniref:EF-hand domain-containing protein n=1 Tax=Solanum bulbocastanum TaxID=147425 RepID=A0AAN8Y1U8_SOLBU
MIQNIDVNGDGYVDIDEFGALYTTIFMDEDEDMQEAFKVFDQNGDGFITIDELKSVLGSLGLKQGGNVEDCRKMINNVDVDGDGRIDFMEFKKMMMRGVGCATFT